MSTTQFLRALVLDNMENQLDCGLDMTKPAEAQELKDYMASCLCALAFLERPRTSPTRNSRPSKWACLSTRTALTKKGMAHLTWIPSAT